jgi:hypothetical protein
VGVNISQHSQVLFKLHLSSCQDLYILCVHGQNIFFNDNIRAPNVYRRRRIIPVPTPNQISGVNVTSYLCNRDSNKSNISSASMVSDMVMY